MIIYLVAVITV